MNEKIKIDLPIIVEGRYDKSTLCSIFDAAIITTDGFSVFNSKEKKALIKRLGDGGIIVLTDSDGGGRQIRSYISGILPKEKIYHLYIPEIFGKEKRKKSPSKSGLIGVEGMKREVLEKIFSPFITDGACNGTRGFSDSRKLTKVDFFNDGLTGADGSSERRNLLAKRIGLPLNMTPNALLQAINLTVGYEEYRKIVSELFGEEETVL